MRLGALVKATLVSTLVLVGLGTTVALPATAGADARSTSATPTAGAATASHGYWLVGRDGGIFSFGSAAFYGSTGAIQLQRPVVGITPTSDHRGYWLVATDGGVFAFGDAGYYGSIPGLGIAPAGSQAPNRLNAPVVGIVPSADGRGYFMVAADGGVFAFGDARFAGSCPSIGGCGSRAVAVMADTTGNGYWLVTALGRVQTFGDAINYGAPGHRGVPITSAAATTDGHGYWILDRVGAVFHYGDAAYHGSLRPGEAPGYDIASTRSSATRRATATGSPRRRAPSTTSARPPVWETWPATISTDRSSLLSAGKPLRRPGVEQPCGKHSLRRLSFLVF